MEKIRIICLETDKKNAVAALHKVGMMDLRKSNLELSDDLPPEELPEISEMLIKTDGSLQALLKQKTVRKKEPKLEGEKLLQYGKTKLQVIDRIYSLVDSRKALNEDQFLLEYADKVATLFMGTGINFAGLKSEVLEYKAYTGPIKQVREFNTAVKKLKINHETVMSESDKKASGIFIAYENGKSIDEATKAVKLVELDLGARYLDGTSEEVLKQTKAAKAANQKQLDQISTEFTKISEAEYSKLVALREMLQIELSRAEASAIFKKTESTSVIEGWIPVKRKHDVENAVKGATSGRYEMETIKTDELAPTYLNRPKIFKPFDFLMNFYSTPRSDEIDPTWIFIISFPIFYGLMLSDVGYGILSFLFVTWVTTRTNPEGLVYNTAKVWQLTSVAAIFFGVLSNQYFGIGLNQYFIPGFQGFDWFTNITSLIIVTILFGLTQVSLGFILGFINNWKHGHKRHAISKLFSLATLLFGTVAIAGAFFSVVSPTITLATTVLAIGCLVGIVAANPGEAVEITSLITHPLSYLRIMGFGLASVIIAFVIDKAFTPNLGSGILIFSVYLVIFSILHFMNMILGIFEGAVQSARLNFVEFFTKFYQGGGVKFTPFSYKRVHTKE